MAEATIGSEAATETGGMIETGAMRGIGALTGGLTGGAMELGEKGHQC